MAPKKAPPSTPPHYLTVPRPVRSRSHPRAWISDWPDPPVRARDSFRETQVRNMTDAITDRRHGQIVWRDGQAQHHIAVDEYGGTYPTNSLRCELRRKDICEGRMKLRRITFCWACEESHWMMIICKIELVGDHCRMMLHEFREVLLPYLMTNIPPRPRRFALYCTLGAFVPLERRFSVRLAMPKCRPPTIHAQYFMSTPPHLRRHAVPPHRYTVFVKWNRITKQVLCWMFSGELCFVEEYLEIRDSRS